MQIFIISIICLIGYKADNANCLHPSVHHPDHGDGHPLRLLLGYQAVAGSPGTAGGG